MSYSPDWKRGKSGMVLFNHATREMTAKIVYYGPGLCGKTTNLLVVFDLLDEKNRGKMLSLATKTDRTLFFDLLPVDVGKVGAFNLKIQLYTVPGQVFYNETRKLVLKGADAVVFVVDSQPSMLDSNRESFQNLLDNLEENQIDPGQIPILIQYNKRDIPGVLPVSKLQEELNFFEYPWVEASALQGDGVMETFKSISKITARHLVNKVKGKPSSARAIGRIDPEEARKAAASQVPLPEPEPEMEPAAIGEITPGQSVDVAENPFAATFEPDAAVAPFDEAAMTADYDAAEEVSLDQLLEGRERPATFSGIAVPIPDDHVDEVEEVDEIDEVPTAEAADNLDDELSLLRSEIERLKHEKEQLREGLRSAIESLQKLL
jgi:signal recognition particle receptor subunit beta